MADTFTIRFDDAQVLGRLREIAQRVDNMAPVMASIGELIAESTKQRFSDSVGPEGQRWAANAEATVLARLAQIKGAYNKKGKLSAKGMTVAMNKKPLVDTGVLQDTIRYQVSSDGRSVAVGTNRFAGEWDGGAAVLHFGDKKGRIPARPFLGLSASDKVSVLAQLDEFLKNAIRD